MDKYKNNLIKTVLELSESKEWDEASKEWELKESYICKDATETCVCGKVGIKDISVLRNVHNDNIFKNQLYSPCKRYFERRRPRLPIRCAITRRSPAIRYFYTCGLMDNNCQK